MEIQLRYDSGELKFVETLDEAFKIAKNDPTIWKISFGLSTGERVRLVRTSEGWTYEPLFSLKE